MLKLSIKTTLVAGLAALLLAGCSTTGERQSDSRYTLSQDAAPSGYHDFSDLESAVPRAEPYSRGGNRSPYTVWGKTYHVMDSGDGYQATGMASWYGAKFHGHKTSNGEIYDMYAMSAAHRSLPLPSYVQVTNLANGRSVIVRVNDRGPFHSERIIDLSYAAAKKLGYADKGTTRVRIAAITVAADGSWTVAGEKPQQTAAAPSPEQPEMAAASAPGSIFVQVAAFRSAESALAFQEEIAAVTGAPVQVVPSDGSDDGWHRVHVGPFDSRAQAEAEIERMRIQESKLGQPIVITQRDGV